MSFRLVETPLDAPVPVPTPRNDAIHGAVSKAIIPAPGIEPLVEALGSPGALTVTAGQQPALLLGPLYTLHKALSAGALAAVLQQRWQRPVIPVFWVGGDDHDWDEARTAWWLGADGELVAAALPERRPDAAMLPMSRMALGPGVQEVVDLFRTTIASSGQAAPILELVAEQYVPGQTMAGAAGQTLAHLLAPLGILVLDSTQADFKRAAMPMILDAIRREPEISAALAAREEELRRQSQDPGIGHSPGETLVMLDGDAGRDRVVRDGQEFRLRRAGTRLSMAEVQAIAERDPTRLSANVLLRPVIESRLLASVAYCAGPGELRYLRLARALFEEMDIVQPAPTPRWSGLVVDAYVDRMTRKFGVSLGELTDRNADVLGRAVREHLPAMAVDAFAQFRRAAAEAFGTLARNAEVLDPSLTRSAQGAERRVEFEAGRLERRFVRNLKRRHATELRQLTRARTAVLPADRPQERVLSVAGVLASHGPALSDAVLAAARRLYAGALEGPPVPA